MKKYIEKENAITQIVNKINELESKLLADRSKEDLELAKNIYRLTKPEFNYYATQKEKESWQLFPRVIKHTIDKVLGEIGYNNDEIEDIKSLSFFNDIKEFLEDAEEIYKERLPINPSDEADFITINDGDCLISYMIGEYEYDLKSIR